jgi:hypothetical protein
MYSNYFIIFNMLSNDSQQWPKHVRHTHYLTRVKLATPDGLQPLITDLQMQESEGHVNTRTYFNKPLQ